MTIRIGAIPTMGVLAILGLSATVACGGAGGSSTDAPGHAASSTWSGTKQMGVAGAHTSANSTAVDANGNICVVGWTDGPLDGSTRTGTNDLFLTKFDAIGTNVFVRQLGASEAWASTFATSTATDTSGNIYIAGYTSGGLDGNTVTGSNDFFLTKYDAGGAKVYTKQIGTMQVNGVFGADTEATSVATDKSGNVYVVGFTDGGLDGNTLTGTQDFFLTKYDIAGTKIFTKQMGVAGVATVANSVATDASGNVYIVGSTNGGLGGNTLTGFSDFFVAKFDATGASTSVNQMGVVGGLTYATSVATDVSGNVYVVGFTNGGLDGNTLMGTDDLFITKYGATGIKEFNRQLGVTGANTRASSIATDGSGGIYIVGSTNGGLDGNTLAGLADFFLTRYDSTGAKSYTRQVGEGGRFTSATSVATDASGGIFVVGVTNGRLDGNGLNPIGFTDLFVTKYSPSGVRQ